MSESNKKSLEAKGWVPFTIDHLLQKHGLISIKSMSLIIIWIALIAMSMISVYNTISGSWVDGNLDQNTINSFFLIYIPLIVGTLLLFWLGFEWGFVPVFLATFVIAFASDMAVYWAILFAFAFVLGLGIYALAYYSVTMDKSLRDFRSFAFFVVISFIASISSSLGAFIWSFAHDMSVTQSTILWRGWWTGVLLQSVVIIAPILFVFTPSIEKIKKNTFELPQQYEVTLKWIYGAILSIAVVLGLFIFGASSLGMQIVESLVAETTVTVSKQFLQATTSFQTVTWISISLVLSVGLGGVYLVGSWNKNLEEVVDSKTSELEKSRFQLEESLKEKDEILDGIHFRMKSNLTTILALLEIQLKYADKQNMDNILQDSYSKLQSLSIVYETMHQTQSVNFLNIKVYLIKLLNQLNLSNKNKKKEVYSNVQSDVIFIDLNRAIPLAIVLNDLINNAYQNAGNNSNTGILRLNVKKNRKNSLLNITVSDNGYSEQASHQSQKKSNLNMKLSRLLVEQLGGTIETGDQSTNLYRIQIPLKSNEMEQNPKKSESYKNKVPETVKKMV